MRQFNISFLFLYFFFISFFLIQKTSAQKVIDSSSYFYELILNPESGTDLKKAYTYYDKRIKQNLELHDTLSAVQDLRLLAIGQFDLGFLNASESSSVEALKLLDKLEANNTTSEARKGLYNQLGKVYRGLNSHENALEYYNKALEWAQNSNDSIVIVNNIANINRDQFEYELAINKLEIVYKKSLNQNNIKQKSRALDNLGFVQSKINHPDALVNMKSALKLRLAENDLKGLYSSYMHFNEYYKDRNIKNKALDYANKCYTTANLINSASFKVDALSRLLELHDNSKILEYIKISDSISNAKQNQQNKYASMRYDVAKEKQRADENKLQREKEKRLKLLYLTIGAIITLLLIFIIYVLRIRYKRGKIKETYLAEIRISKKIHDELANDMSDVMNYVEQDLETSTNKKAVLLNTLEDIYLRARDISTETASIDLINFSESIKHLLMQHNLKSTKVVINDVDNINWKDVPDHKKTAVYRSLQELMINMKKHSQAKLVSVVFKRKNKKNEIHYTDDGIGVSIAEVKVNGLQNVESRIKGIDGSFNFITSKGNGFKAMIIFNS